MERSAFRYSQNQQGDAPMPYNHSYLSDECLAFMNNQLSFRRAVAGDAETLSLLICENAGAMLAPYYTQQQWATFIKYYEPGALAGKIDRQVVFCAEIQGEIVATVALDGDFVLGFYTRLSYMGQGIGTLVIQHLEAYALAHNIKQIQLAASPVGLRFYYKHGWEKVKDMTIFYDGVGFEETLMLKKLG